MTKRPKIEISDLAFRALQLEAAKQGRKQYDMASVMICGAMSEEVRKLLEGKP